MKNRLIIGMDISYNSPGIVCTIIDSDGKELTSRYLSFTTVKKYVCDRPDGEIAFNDKKHEVSGLAHIYEYKNKVKHFIIDFLTNSNVPIETINENIYVGIEDYAYSASGRITELSEMCHGLKEMVWEELGAHIRIYDIASIKMWSTGAGNADKIAMEDAYLKLDQKFDLSYMPLVREKKSGVPSDNIIDAFFINKMLQQELLIRDGILLLKNLPEQSRRIYNRVTKAEPINLLDRDFIKKDSV